MKVKVRGMACFMLVIAVTAVMLVNSFASGLTPGSAEDPLVSKSYVDAKITQVMDLINGKTSAANTGSAASVTGYTFEPVSASVGQIVVGGEGSEIILRSGKAVGYCVGENGLINVTSGNELFNGYEVTVNHLILVPRNDGRGVKVIEDAWFIIKGEYHILN